MPFCYQLSPYIHYSVIVNLAIVLKAMRLLAMFRSPSGGSRVNIIDLKSRVAIITGGARGIGFAAAERMLISGATVAIWDIDQKALDSAIANRLAL